jgi:hypothetical protein
MPKIIRIEDGQSTLQPLRITVRRGKTVSPNRTKGPSIRVKCGCCSESVVIHYEEKVARDPHRATLEINGVLGTLDQWRKIFEPLLEHGMPKL